MAQLTPRILLLFFFVKTLFIQTNEQESIVKSSNDPIKAEPGSDVILPCETKPPSDVSRLLVEWTRGSQTVHLSRRGHDFPEEQDPLFKDRTQLFHQEMKHGNISLKLFKVTKEDEGTYTCSVPKLGSKVTEGLVTLIIEDPGIKEEHKVELGIKEGHKECERKVFCAGDIAAIVLGCVIIIIIIIISAIVFWRKHRGAEPENEDNKESIVKSSNDPIKAERGSDVNLTCETKPPSDVSRMLVKWTRGSETVHTSVRGHDIPDKQDPLFKDRTQLFHQEMKDGNISLKLLNVTKEDEGNCAQAEGSSHGQGHVTLIIEEPGIKEEHKGHQQKADQPSPSQPLLQND